MTDSVTKKGCPKIHIDTSFLCEPVRSQEGERRKMNLRQKKKLFRKVTGQNPPRWMHYSSRRFHNFLCKPWGGLAELKKQAATRAVEGFNWNISRRNEWIRSSHRYRR